MARTRPGAHLVHLGQDHLPVECWCRSHIVGVHQRDIFNMLTNSCGMPHCDKQDREAREAKGG